MGRAGVGVVAGGMRDAGEPGGRRLGQQQAQRNGPTFHGPYGDIGRDGQILFELEREPGAGELGRWPAGMAQLLDDSNAQATHQHENFATPFAAIILEQTFAAQGRVQERCAVFSDNFDQDIARGEIHFQVGGYRKIRDGRTTKLCGGREETAGQGHFWWPGQLACPGRRRRQEANLFQSITKLISFDRRPGQAGLLNFLTRIDRFLRAARARATK